VAAGAALSFATIALGRLFGYEAIPKSLVGGPDAATAVLATIAASVVSLAALVLTITIVVVQLASGQFSPPDRAASATSQANSLSPCSSRRSCTPSSRFAR
jgi:uncharacterized membrane protein